MRLIVMCIGCAISISTVHTISAAPITSFGGHYYTLTSGPSTWVDAELEALELGGDLVTINSVAEQNFLVSTYLPTFADQHTKSYWIGIDHDYLQAKQSTQAMPMMLRRRFN